MNHMASAAEWVKVPQLVGQSELRLLGSRRQVRTSRALVAAARARIGQRRMICGGSDLDQREIVRARLAAATLPRLHGMSWAGRASGSACSVCTRVILPPNIEYQVDETRNLRAHLACYMIWLDESNAFTEEGGDVSAGFQILDVVELRAQSVVSRGRVIECREEGRWICVRWTRRPGYERKVTIERAWDLRKQPRRG
jgi:hypothetical protein